MAKALIKAIDYVNPDPAEDLAGSHKRGDVIVVKPDDHVWSVAEGPPKFEIVTVPDSWLPLSMGEALEQSAGEVLPSAMKGIKRLQVLASRERDRKPIRRHRWAIDLDSGNAIKDRRHENRTDYTPYS